MLPPCLPADGGQAGEREQFDYQASWVGGFLFGSVAGGAAFAWSAAY